MRPVASMRRAVARWIGTSTHSMRMRAKARSERPTAPSAAQARGPGEPRGAGLLAEVHRRRPGAEVLGAVAGEAGGPLEAVRAVHLDGLVGRPGGARDL